MTTPIVHACAVAWDHIATRTLAGATPAEIRACMRSAYVVAHEEHLQVLTVMHAPDLYHVRQCLNDINRGYKAALQQMRQEGKG
jgi:hypothetical protein